MQLKDGRMTRVHMWNKIEKKTKFQTHIIKQIKEFKLMTELQKESFTHYVTVFDYHNDAFVY